MIIPEIDRFVCRVDSSSRETHRITFVAIPFSILMIEYRELFRGATDTIPRVASPSLSPSLSFSMDANLRRGFRSRPRKIRSKSKSAIKRGRPGEKLIVTRKVPDVLSDELKGFLRRWARYRYTVGQQLITAYGT